MQDETRKQLKALCLTILQHEEEYQIKDQIAQTQALLKHLYRVEFANEKQQTSVKDASTMSFNEDKVPLVEKKSEPNKVDIKRDEFGGAHVQATSDKELGSTSVNMQKNEEKVQLNEKTNTESNLGLADFVPANDEKETSKSSGSLNQRLAQANLHVGLNDRIAFVKHLFSNSMDDFNRVVSQLNTFEDFEEAENFIDEMVKPDYDWYQKEEYELRFKNVIRQRFGLDELEE